MTYSISYTYCTDCNLFKIDSATGVVTFITSPDFERPADSDHDNVYKLEVSVSDGLDTRKKEVTITVTNGIDPINTDLNGDHQSDIFLQNGTDGTCYVWQMNGLALKDKGSGEVGWKPGADWVARATGDFDGDGKSDLFLQNVKDGLGYIWEMDGLNLKEDGGGEVGWKAGAEWVAKASGDFDGDGKSDILLQNVNDGGCYIWGMNGLGLKDGGSGEIAWKPGANWVARATGDFDGDGKSDILLQNVKDGGCYIWEMKGLALKDGGSGEIAWAPGKEWQVADTGDGKSDILLQNVDTGGCYIWEMDGLNLKVGGSGEVGWKPGPDWLVSA